MKFITVRDFRTSPAQIWKQLPDEQEMIITNNGRPIALLTPISDGTLEETVASMRKARAINAIKQLQLSSLKTGKNRMTEEEIENEIREARKSRKR
jgi:antitoxin (DNA-binding transcriptional repressor) of toxin-antitoxin stability system